MKTMKDDDRLQDSARFIVSKASAGSGKTFQLVLIYLTLALSVDDNLDERSKRRALEKRFTRILAITFTNAAVNEMKQRILQELAAICDLDTAKRPLIEEKLCKTTGLAVDELRWRAKIVHNAILHHYTDLAVSTIDSFSNRIVKTFALDLNLPQNFDVSLDEQELIDRVSDSLLALVGSDDESELTTLLYSYSEEKMEEDGSYNIERNLREMIPYVLREDAPEYIKKIENLSYDDCRKIRREFSAANKAFEARIEAKAREGVELIARSGVSETLFYQGASSAPAYFKKTLEKKYTDEFKKAKAFFETDKVASSSCDAASRDAIAAIKPQLVALYNEIENIKQSELKQYYSRKRLMANLYETSLMKRISEVMEEYYQENDLLHISEINKRIAQVVGDSDDAPFIYERIGNIYQNILIDEFQDTSRQQWNNLVPLVENSVSEGHTSLVVGDGKQAIYRFRNGDVRQFVRLPHVDGHANLNIENPAIHVSFPKKDNWRSCPEVVRFNNNYFSYIANSGYADNHDLRDIYIGTRLDGEDDLVQHWKENPTKPTGFVKVSFSPRNDALWEQVADEVDRQHQLGFQYSEICVLAPQHKYLTNISDILLERGVKIVSKESLRLENSHLVRLLLETMRCVSNPGNKCATLLALMELEYIGLIGPTYRQRLMMNDGDITLPALAQESGIELDFGLLESLSLYDLCETLLRIYNPDGFENGYALKLLNIVADYSRVHRQDLAEFLQWMDSHIEKESLAMAGGADSVPLQTIHTAKGLQWPVVIVVLPKKAGRNDKKIWVALDNESFGLPVGLVTPTSTVPTLFDTQFDEEQRLVEMDTTNMVYVALTRPEQKLIIYATCNDASRGSDTHQKFLMRFAEEYLDSNTAAASGKSKEEETLLYFFGEDHPAPAPSSTDRHAPLTDTIESVSFPDYQSRVRYAWHANEERSTSSEREFGTMVHDMLSRIDSAADIERELERYARRGSIAESNLSALRRLLESTVNGSESRRFFDSRHKVLKEATLMCNGEERRPDRVILCDQETWVVDFKTGAPHDSHKAQVQQYCEAMEAMHYPAVKGYLLYLSERGCTVMQV